MSEATHNIVGSFSTKGQVIGVTIALIMVISLIKLPEWLPQFGFQKSTIDLMQFSGGLLLLFGSFVAVILIRTREAKAMQKFAESNGLRFDQKQLSMDGVWAGVPIAVKWVVDKKKATLLSEASVDYRTDVTATATTALSPIWMASENILSKLATALGSTDIDIGDPAFDKRFQVRAMGSADAKRLLANPVIRTALLDSGFASIQISGNRIVASVDYIEFGTEKVEKMIRAVVMLAKAA